MDDLKEKRVLVTGAANGIGLAVARAFAREGSRLLLVDINRQQLEQVTDELRSMGCTAKGYFVDIADRGAVRTMAADIDEEFGGVDVLVNVAGVVIASDISDMELEDWDWIMGVNLWGPIYTIHEFVPGMIERGYGHVANVASVGGMFSLGMIGAYCTTKFALVGLTEALYQDLAEHNVGVTTVCPGFTRTSIVRRAATRGYSYDKITRLTDMVMRSPVSISTEKTARLILKAVKGDKRIVITTLFGKAFVLFKRLSPGLFHRVIMWGRGIDTRRFR